MNKHLTILTLAMLLSVAGAWAQGGTTGALTWELNNGTLTISGVGEMPDYHSPDDNAPWYEYQDAITVVEIENGVTSIGNEAFSRDLIGEYKFTSIDIPNSVTRIGDCAFINCHSLISVTLPNSVITIGNSAFSSCFNLTSVTLPNSVTTIGTGAFSLCVALKSIAIPNSLTTIETGTFWNSALESITIPSSVTTIGNMAFEYCSALSSITALNLVPVEIDYGVFNGFDPNVDLTAITLEVPTSAVQDYQAAEVWGEMNIVGGGMLVNPVSGDPQQGYTTGDGLYGGRATATVTAVPRNGYRFVNWTKDGAVISTANPYSFTVTEDIELVASFEAGEVGIVETLRATSLQIYPNPTRGELTITCYRHCGLDPQSPENDEIAGQTRNDIHGVDVFDMMGRVVHVETPCMASLQPDPELHSGLNPKPEITFDLSNVPAGMYFVRIQTKNGIVTKKVVKQ